MLDIKNKASLAINKFIDDAINASPDLKDKLDNISPISFDLSVADIGPFYIKINKEEVAASLDYISDNDFSVSIGLVEAAKYITHGTIEKNHIVGDAEKDPKIIVDKLKDFMFCNFEIKVEERLDAINIFKGDVPENYYVDGSWDLSYDSVPNQVYNLILYFISLPEFQLK